MATGARTAGLRQAGMEQNSPLIGPQLPYPITRYPR